MLLTHELPDVLYWRGRFTKLEYLILNHLSVNSENEELPETGRCEQSYIDAGVRSVQAQPTEEPDMTTIRSVRPT